MIVMFGIPKFFGFERKVWQNSNALLLVGRRRQGKSTILAMICQVAVRAGYTVYSNYPIDGALKIPKKTLPNGKVVTDKEFLYNNPVLRNSFVLLDEVSNLWNNRSWGRWTEDDSDFFNFLGKNNTRVVMACQYYDTIDLNVKRSIDSTWFVTKSLWPNVSVVECDIHDICKVEDLNSHVLDTKYRKITYEACEIPDGKYYFYRKKWYPYFLTEYIDPARVQTWELSAWHDLAFAEDGEKRRSEPKTDDLPFDGTGIPSEYETS